MSSFHLTDLPPELLLQTISHLPITSLLQLSATNRALHTLSLASLTTIHLTSFPKKLHTTLTRLDLESQLYHPDQTVHLTLPQPTGDGLATTSRQPSPSRSLRSHLPPTITDAKSARQTLLSDLNHHLEQILLSSTLQQSNLRTLSLHTWSPSASLLQDLATSPHFSSLRDLTLDFHHPTHRHPSLPSHYWSHPDKPSPIWNSIAGLGDSHSRQLRLRSLQRLTLFRSGITSAQLSCWIDSNPHLKNLSFRLVRGVDINFLNYLARRAEHSAPLQTLEIVDCPAFVSTSSHPPPKSWDDADDDDKGYEWITKLARAGLQRLMIRNCEGLGGDRGVKRLRWLNRRVWRIPIFEVGGGEEGYGVVSVVIGGGVIEVDDEEEEDAVRESVNGGWGGMDVTTVKSRMLGGKVLRVDDSDCCSE